MKNFSSITTWFAVLHGRHFPQRCLISVFRHEEIPFTTRIRVIYKKLQNLSHPEVAVNTKSAFWKYFGRIKCDI